jgi:CDP-diacylglycerol--glycerol-3-phosphate 3-phosphatidyltransferase
VDVAAHLITVARIGLAFVAVGLFQTGFAGQVAAFLLTVLVIYMDALDGIVARRLGIASKLGALFDITGDRIVENIYWIYFTAIGVVSFWVPMIVIARGLLTDSVRSLAFGAGKTPFGESTMQRSQLGRWLVSSRFSRAVYGTAKAVIFCYLGGLIALRSGAARFGLDWVHPLLPALDLIGQVLVWIVLAMCVIRGIPVLVDGRVYLLEKRYPNFVRKEHETG